MKLYVDNYGKFVCPCCGRTFPSEMSCRGHLGRCPQKENNRLIPITVNQPISPEMINLLTGKKRNKKRTRQLTGAAGAHEQVSMDLGEFEQQTQYVEQQNLVRMLTNEIPHQLSILNQQVGDLKEKMVNIEKVAEEKKKQKEPKGDWIQSALKYIGFGLTVILAIDVIFNSKKRDGLQGKLLGKLM